MMRQLWAVLLLSGIGFTQQTALAGEAVDVCIRNYFEPATKYDPCTPENNVTKRYAYVQNMDDAEATICALSYADANCALKPEEFQRVFTIKGGKICTMNFDQPGVINYCRENPGLYQYAEGIDEEEGQK